MLGFHLGQELSLNVSRFCLRVRILVSVILKYVFLSYILSFSLDDPKIFSCILIAGLVERVVLLGAPIAIKNMNWEAARKVVVSHFIHIIYSY